jgi:hypothetical protein
MSTIGVGFQILGVAIGFWNFWRSRTRGDIAGNDPWGAPTLEWSIPSPPPDYNFAKVPKVTSRYPLWDVKSPALTSNIPHSPAEEASLDIDVGGQHAGRVSRAIGNPPGGPVGASGEAPAGPSGPPPTPRRVPTAKELGIPMPNPSIKPLFVALFMTLMFASLIAIHKDKTQLAVALVIVFGSALTASLYGWLLTPLEDEH